MSFTRNRLRCWPNHVIDRVRNQQRVVARNTQQQRLEVLKRSIAAAQCAVYDQLEREMRAPVLNDVLAGPGMAMYGYGFERGKFRVRAIPLDALMRDQRTHAAIALDQALQGYDRPRARPPAVASHPEPEPIDDFYGGFDTLPPFEDPQPSPAWWIALKRAWNKFVEMSRCR